MGRVVESPPKDHSSVRDRLSQLIWGYCNECKEGTSDYVQALWLNHCPPSSSAHVDGYSNNQVKLQFLLVQCLLLWFIFKSEFRRFKCRNTQSLILSS